MLSSVSFHCILASWVMSGRSSRYPETPCSLIVLASDVGNRVARAGSVKIWTSDWSFCSYSFVLSFDAVCPALRDDVSSVEAKGSQMHTTAKSALSKRKTEMDAQRSLILEVLVQICSTRGRNMVLIKTDSTYFKESRWQATWHGTADTLFFCPLSSNCFWMSAPWSADGCLLLYSSCILISQDFDWVFQHGTILPPAKWCPSWCRVHLSTVLFIHGMNFMGYHGSYSHW